jgi:hypothetical protein
MTNEQIKKLVVGKCSKLIADSIPYNLSREDTIEIYDALIEKMKHTRAFLEAVMKAKEECDNAI